VIPESEKEILSILKETKFEDVYLWIEETYIALDKATDSNKKAFIKCKLIEKQEQNTENEEVLPDIQRLHIENL
jgi:hypothetical protein